MTKISFSLIRTHCPQVLGLDNGPDADNEVLILNGLDIDEIDGLEVVSDIAELHLTHNNISKIQNMEFLFKLRVLDLSYNNISAASLRESITTLPKSLTSINLLNNPCCQDENVLCQLQDHYPALGIIVGYDDEETNHNDNTEEDEEENDDDDDDEEKNTTLPASSELSPSHKEVDMMKYEPLNADDILKQVVERKCKHSSLPSFNLEQAVAELQLECDAAIEHVGHHHVHDNPTPSIDYEVDSKTRVDQLMERSRGNRIGSEDFIHRLRETSMQMRDKLFASNST